MPPRRPEFVCFVSPDSISGADIVIRNLDFSKFLLELSMSTLDLWKLIFERLAHLLEFPTKRVDGLERWTN